LMAGWSPTTSGSKRKPELFNKVAVGEGGSRLSDRHPKTLKCSARAIAILLC
jgi:hypothetical protein